MDNRSQDCNILTCQNIEKTYKNGMNRQCVIKPSNLTIKEGTMNLVIGRSGSGKTTLLNILAGLEQPSNGSVYYRQDNFYQLTEKKQAEIRGNNYGFIFQAFHLIPELTVYDNIQVPLIITNNKVDVSYFNAIMELLDLKDRLDDYPTELSGGEQQRVAIARAMIHKPEILFADEPTGNLDEMNSNIIMKLMKHIHNQYHTTIILVTHDLSLLTNPDQTFYISNGEIKTDNGVCGMR